MSRNVNMIRLLFTLLSAVQNREISGAMRSWITFVSWSKEKAHETEVDDLRRQLDSLRREKKSQEDALCRRVVLKLLHSKLSAAMNAWHEYNRVQCLMTRVGTRLMRQGLARCMNRWKEQTKENKRLRLVQTCGGTLDESRACGYCGKMEKLC